jgi:hypothetical protein
MRSYLHSALVLGSLEPPPKAVFAKLKLKVRRRNNIVRQEPDRIPFEAAVLMSVN